MIRDKVSEGQQGHDLPGTSGESGKDDLHRGVPQGSTLGSEFAGEALLGNLRLLEPLALALWLWLM